MNYTIKSENLTVTVSDMGAELVSVKSSDGFEYIWDGDERYWKGQSPILFPVCGQLLNKRFTYDGKEYNMNGHGFARRCVFEVIAQRDNAIAFKLTQNEVTLAQYPFDFELIAEYEVNGEELKTSFTVKNTDSKILPYMLGWHPGFNLEGDSPINSFKLDFEGKDSLTWYPLQNECFVRPYGEEYPLKNQCYALNEEEIYANDTMIFVGTGDKTKLHSNFAKHSIEFAWSENLPYFCVWKDDHNEARFICLEPWSGVPADGVVPENFNERKMSRLNSGESETYSYNIKFN